MKINQTIDENGKRLRRIAALLFALADLSELAAGRSSALCLIVMWLIRPSEAVARDYVEAIAPGAAWLPVPEPLRSATGPAEAIRLARSLRLLAATLAALTGDCLAQSRATHSNCRRNLREIDEIPAYAHSLALYALEYPDTS